MTSDLQTRAKEVVMPTSQLLDLLCIMFPQQTRKNLNSRLDRYHDYQKVVNIKGMTITYAGQPRGNGTQHLWAVSVVNAEVDLQEIFQKYQSKLGSIVLRGAPQDNQGQNAILEWHGLFFRSTAELKIAEALDDNHILFFPNSRGMVSDRQFLQILHMVNRIISAGHPSPKILPEIVINPRLDQGLQLFLG